MKKLSLKYQSAPHRDSVSCQLAEDNLPKTHDSVIQSDRFKSYTVCLAAMLCNSIVMGYCYSFGVLLPPLLDHFKEDTATTAWVGSLYISVGALLGPMAANLCDRYGCRITAVLGGLTCILGLLLTSQAPSIFCMYLTYSVIVGLGTCCVYTASFVVVPRYFLKRRSLATGVVSCGPSGGSLVMGPLLQLLLDTLGWRNTFLAMAGMASLICVLALIYDPRTAKEISASEGGTNTAQHGISENFSWSTNIFTNPTLLMWSVCGAAVFLGLNNPQVLLVKYAEQHGLSPDESAMFFCYMGLSSTIARILIGRVCDFKCVNAQAINQAALYFAAAAICLLPQADSYYRLLAYSVVFGFCEGSFGSTIHIQVIGSVKSHLTSKALGFYLAITSPGLAAGPPMAGFIADRMNSYVPAFYASAAIIFVGATIPFMSFCLNKKQSSNILEMQLSSDEKNLVERETVL